jgi:hypothetical protein
MTKTLTYEQLGKRNAELESMLLETMEELLHLIRARYQPPKQTDEQIGPYGLCPGVQVVLVNRVATIRRMLPYWNVEVELLDGSLETWWRGNLQFVLPTVHPSAKGVL